MKNLYIKSISIKKNGINIFIYEKDSKNILRYSYPNNEDSLNLIFNQIVKKIWNCYPSANSGLWKYLQMFSIEYCRENNIHLSSETCFGLNSGVFREFLSKLKECTSEKKKFLIRTGNGFYLEKKDSSFNFKLTERKIDSYCFSFCEMELFKLLNKNNPIFAKVLYEKL